MSEFEEFPKMARLSRRVIITEKIDGTNAQICIGEDGSMKIGSRTRWITPEDDNYGFAKWAHENHEELQKLGSGRHFGEWWGAGIQRRYDLSEKRFSLFNVQRWGDDSVRPACCHVVPVIYDGLFSTEKADGFIYLLQTNGSFAAPGFMDPEGIVIYHTAAGIGFKKTVKKDEMSKQQAAMQEN